MFQQRNNIYIYIHIFLHTIARVSSFYMVLATTAVLTPKVWSLPSPELARQFSWLRHFGVTGPFVVGERTTNT